MPQGEESVILIPVLCFSCVNSAKDAMGGDDKWASVVNRLAGR